MNELLESIRQDVAVLSAAGLVSQATLSQYRKLCPQQAQPLSGLEIKQIRLDAEVTPSVFAQCLNIPLEQLLALESDQSVATGPLLKLLILAHEYGLEHIA